MVSSKVNKKNQERVKDTRLRFQFARYRYAQHCDKDDAKDGDRDNTQRALRRVAYDGHGKLCATRHVDSAAVTATRATRDAPTNCQRCQRQRQRQRQRRRQSKASFNGLKRLTRDGQMVRVRGTGTGGGE